MNNILELKNINMRFKSGDGFIDVLNDVSFAIEQGKSAALIGQSGSGKSTLLQIAALLEKPSSGQVLIHNQNALLCNDNDSTKIRRENIGFVYQFHNLLPEFTTLENVILPQALNHVPKKIATEKAKELLESVGLSHRIHHNVQKLSGGEKQRAAIARAIANDPNIMVADEPTGNLDTKTAFVIFDLLLNLIQTKKMSLLMATHNVELAKLLDNQIILENKIIKIS